MRTKTLLLSAAVLAAGLSASMAQSVYSVNAVGYVNLTLGGGYTIIGNPLNGTNNNLSTILPTVPDGTFILKWDPAIQNFKSPAQYFAGIGWLPDDTLKPGEGAFINIPGAGTTVTFVGEVPQGSLTNKVAANYTLISQIVPQQIGLSAASYPAVDGDYVLFWDNATQNFAAPTYQYFAGIGWLPSDPTPAVGQGFFINSTTSHDWVRTFSVN